MMFKAELQPRPPKRTSSAKRVSETVNQRPKLNAERYLKISNLRGLLAECTFKITNFTDTTMRLLA